ncbi:MAG: SOS response-associated peptidase [Bacillota bacterium]
MCGRFAQVLSRKILELLYRLENIAEMEPRYNIAPSQHALVLRTSPQGGKRELSRLQWGLIPAWVREERSANKPINARVETVELKPSFLEAFRQRRALIPASGYYEWQKMGGKKQPYFIHSKDERPLSLAGIWEKWERGGQTRETFAILTVAACGRMAELHNRMPLILPERAFDRWLAGDTGPAELQEMLRPFPEVELAAYPVSPLVNNPANDSPACLQELEVGS